MTHALAADVLLVASTAGAFAVGLVTAESLYLLLTRRRTMREFKRGDVVRLTQNVVGETSRGVRALQSGWEFEVLACFDGNVRAKDGNGCTVLLPAYAVEFVRGPHSPPDDDGGGKPAARQKLGKRPGQFNMPRAA